MAFSTDILFRPFRIKTLELSNRIVMAPMTRLFAPDGIVGKAHAEYYQRRASGGVGLILSEGTVIDRPASRNHPAIPLFYGAPALGGWKRIAEAVHQAGGRMGPQLWHTGAVASATSDWRPSAPPESPSGFDVPGVPRGIAMSDSAIADTIAAFARAAADAMASGFDTVELHGAHGYLIDQYFWSGTNLRADAYGGSAIGERTRFAAEIIGAVRAEVGPDFPIIMRVSQWKQQDYDARIASSPNTMAQWLEPLVDAGVDILHCSQRRFWEPEFPDIDGKQGLNFAGWAKKITGAATISVGSVGLSSDFMGAFRGEDSMSTGIERLVERMERDEFDLIAVGRVLLADACWAEKIRAGQIADLKNFDASMLSTLD